LLPDPLNLVELVLVVLEPEEALERLLVAEVFEVREGTLDAGLDTDFGVEVVAEVGFVLEQLVVDVDLTAGVEVVQFADRLDAVQLLQSLFGPAHELLHHGLLKE